MKRLCICITICSLWVVSTFAAETATFVFKDGKIEFGKLFKVENENVFALITGDDGLQKDVSILKSSLVEVIFDSGEKLDLSLSSYPPVKETPQPSSTITQETTTIPASTVNQTDMQNTTSTPLTRPIIPLEPSEYRNPFVYAAYSSVVPGLGQVIQKQYIKGAVSFGLLGISIGGTIYSWSSTSKFYLTMENARKRSGSYSDEDFEKFVFRKRGAQVISIVTGILYIVNIADAAYDAHIFNKCLENNRIHHTMQLENESVGYTFSLNF